MGKIRDLLQHCGQIVQNVFVAEPDHPIAVGAEIRRPCGVLLHLCIVNPAVKFHRQFGVGAVEIQNKLADRVLLPKPQAVEPIASQRLPKCLLRRCHPAAKLPAEVLT